MMSRLRMLICLLALVLLMRSSFAVEQSLPAEKLLVDVVTLKSGTQYRGAVLGRADDGTVSMAVQREWLKRHQPKELESLVAIESKQTQAALQQLSDRLNAWLQAAPEPATLRAFVELERERVEKQARALQARGPQVEPPQFVWVTFAEGRVRNSFVQPAAWRKWMALAFQQKLADIEKRSGDDIRKELAAQGLTIDAPVSLWERLPLQPQSDEEWTARRALVESQFGKRIELQGLGETWIRTDGDAKKPDLAQLLPSVLQGQLQARLGDLLGDAGNKPKSASASFNKAIEQAEAANVAAFKATELKLDLERSKAAVTTKLVVRMAPGKWDVIWQQTIEEDGSKVRPEAERRIEADPQVKEALGLLKGLDIGGGDVVTKAIRVGAAVMQAQQRADSDYQNFVGQYTRRLDGPPLRK